MAQKFFKSEDVRVYPCGYRGTKHEDESLVYNPQARMTTEEGLTNIGGLGDLSRNYVVSYGNNILKFVLGGYLFEVNTENYDDLADAYIYISLKDVSVVESDDQDSKTSVLASLYENADDRLDT